MIIETERLILRPFIQSDHKPFAAMHADPETMRFYPDVWSTERSQASIQRAEDELAKNGFSLLAVELEASGEFIGAIGLIQLSEIMQNTLPDRPQVEIGWRLQRNAWGQQYAPEGAAACLQYAWEKLNLPEVVSFTYQGNLPSQRVMEKIGMTRDLSGDFQHPNIPEGNKIRPHVLYRIKNPDLL